LTGAEGYVATDTVTFGGLTVQNQGFAVANIAINDLDTELEDGLMGFGIKALASDRQFTLFENLVANGSLDNPYFGIWLERDLTLAAEERAKGGAVGGPTGPGELSLGDQIASRLMLIRSFRRSPVPGMHRYYKV
jgi:hypothetical protein